MFFLPNQTFESLASGNSGTQARFGASSPHDSRYPYRPSPAFQPTQPLPDSFARQYGPSSAYPPASPPPRSHMLQRLAQQREKQAEEVATRASLAAQKADVQRIQATVSAKLASDAFETSQDPEKPLVFREESYAYGLTRSKSADFHAELANLENGAYIRLGKASIAILAEADELYNKAAWEAEQKYAEMARQAQQDNDKAGPSHQKNSPKPKSKKKNKHGKEPSSSQPQPAKYQPPHQSNKNERDGRGNSFAQRPPANGSTGKARFTEDEELRERVGEALNYENSRHLSAPKTPLLKPGEGIPVVIKEFDTGEKLTYLPDKVCEIAFLDPGGNPLVHIEYPRPVLGAVKKVSKKIIGDEYHYIISAKECDTKRVRVPRELFWARR
jgi:hypothetical protein